MFDKVDTYALITAIAIVLIAEVASAVWQVMHDDCQVSVINKIVSLISFTLVTFIAFWFYWIKEATDDDDRKGND